MSGRGASGGILSSIAAQRVNTAHLLEVDFEPIIYLTDASVALQWLDKTYLPSPFLGFSPISETSDLLVNTCTVSLSGVDPGIIVLLLRETYLNRKLRIYRAVLDDLRVMASPLLIFDGRMDRPVISVDPDNGSVICTVEGVSHWIDFDRVSGRHTNDAEQQKFFPGDRGFSKVSVLPSQVFWGSSRTIEVSKRGDYAYSKGKRAGK